MSYTFNIILELLLTDVALISVNLILGLLHGD